MAKCFYLLNLACKHMGYLLFFMHFNTCWRYSLIILMVTFFFFLAAPCHIWDISSKTKDETCTLCSGD